MKTVTRKIGKIDKVRALAIKYTAEHFDVDPSHVRKVDDGERNNEEIKAYYRNKYAAIKQAINA